jgi:hypothetical protein
MKRDLNMDILREPGLDKTPLLAEAGSIRIERALTKKR